MSNIKNIQQQEIYDILEEVCSGKTDVDAAFEEMLDYVDSSVLESPPDCPACAKEGSGVVSGGTQHTCL